MKSREVNRAPGGDLHCHRRLSAGKTSQGKGRRGAAPRLFSGLISGLTFSGLFLACPTFFSGLTFFGLNFVFRTLFVLISGLPDFFRAYFEFFSCLFRKKARIKREKSWVSPR